MSALLLDNISLQAGGRELFTPISLRAEPGVITSVTGPSGAGKSSLLLYLCGVLGDGLSGSGTVRLGEMDLLSLPPEQRGLGLMFQDPLLFPHLDVAGNLLFGLRATVPRRERQARVRDALSSVGLDGMAERDPATLSGGQQTRVALLRVLLSEPRVLLLDEPFSSLDAANRHRVRDLVFAEARRLHLPTLLVTHDRDDIVAADGPVVALQPAEGESC